MQSQTTVLVSASKSSSESPLGSSLLVILLALYRCMNGEKTDEKKTEREIRTPLALTHYWKDIVSPWKDITYFRAQSHALSQVVYVEPLDNSGDTSPPTCTSSQQPNTSYRNIPDLHRIPAYLHRIPTYLPPIYQPHQQDTYVQHIGPQNSAAPFLSRKNQEVGLTSTSASHDQVCLLCFWASNNGPCSETIFTIFLKHHEWRHLWSSYAIMSAPIFTSCFTCSCKRHHEPEMVRARLSGNHVQIIIFQGIMEFCSVFGVVAVLLLCYSFYGALYRLVLSPIADFPGPRLAALSFWYEFYYDVFLQGRYTWKIRDLHEKYGPIIRINPEELHVLDQSFYDTLYVRPTVRKTDKWYWSARMFGTSAAAVGTVDHHLHRHRRSALNPFFSKKQISQLEPRVVVHVHKLIARLKGLRGARKAVNLVDAFTALTADLISDLAYGQTYDFLSHGDFNPKWHMFMMELSRNTHLMKQVPILYNLLEILPRALVSFIHPITRQLFALQDCIGSQVRVAQGHQPDEKQTSSAKWCMLDSLLSSTHLTPQDKTPYRLVEEALTLLGAGTVTTAWTLSVTCYHILSDPRILTTIKDELRTLPAEPTWNDYESMPYLAAVINEGLRLSHGTSHRLARISPHMTLQYDKHVIPAGTPVSMTQMHMHLDENIFPSPHDFVPDRWLPESSSEEEIRERKRYLVPFSKGSRMCVGMNLTYAELFLTIGRLFGPGGVDMELWETEERDVRVESDWFNPVPWMGSKGVRVLV